MTCWIKSARLVLLAGLVKSIQLTDYYTPAVNLTGDLLDVG